jgi:5-carboxyvanillate decarboxylase
MQVLFPGLLYAVQLEDLGGDGTVLAKRINDTLSKAVKNYPKRFAGLASLSLQDPGGAAEELDRAVNKLGLKGGQICSNVNGEYLDDKKYWVFFEMAEKLGVPIYIHPRWPSPDIAKPFFTYPILAGSMFGFAADTSLCAMRLICSGVFDKFPRLRIILGHLGEALPFWLWRLDNRWQRESLRSLRSYASDRQIKKKPSQYVKENIFVTTSGMFFQPALLCTYLALGADRILFAVDYPFEDNKAAVNFMEEAPICDRDKEKIYHLNAEKVLAI